MTKFLSLIALLALCWNIGQAQNAPAVSPIELIVNAATAPVYNQLGDTAKTGLFLSRGSKLRLINDDNPQWSLVARGTKQYYINSKNVAGNPNDLVGLVRLTPADISAIPRDPATGTVLYSGVLPVEGLSKNELFVRAKTWVINTYNSPRTVTKTEERDAGIIIIKAYTDASIKILFNTNERLYYTAKISTKDGRYKYDLTEFYFQAYASAANPYPEQIPVERYLNNSFYPSNGKPNKVALIFAQAFLERAGAIEASLKKAMAKGEDW